MTFQHLRRRAIPVAIGLGIVMTTAYFLLTEHELLGSLRQRMEWIAYDLRMKYTLPQTIALHSEVVIVDIDEKSLAAEGRWPWPRARLAKLADKLLESGVVVVAFDMFFAEPERNIALRVRDAIAAGDDEKQASLVPLLNELAVRFDGDTQLATSLARGDVVLGYVFHRDGHNVGRLGPALPIKNAAEAAQATARTMPNYTANLSRLQEAARGGGFVNADPDGDGTIRRYHLVHRHGGEIYPSLALEAVRLFYFIDAVTLKTETIGETRAIAEVVLDPHRSIPTDGEGAALVPFRGPHGSFNYVSATDVLNDRAELTRLANKIAIVGTTAAGLFDLRSTPVQEIYPGVELHANMVAALLDQNYPPRADQPEARRQLFPHQPRWAEGLDFTVIALIGVMLAFVLPLLPPIRSFLVAAAAMAAVLTFNTWLWLEWKLISSLAVPLIMIFLLATADFAYGYLFEERGRHRLRGQFGRYVPRELVDEMAEHPERSFGFEGERRVLTVLFADIRGFTTISESLSAARLKDLLNRFFTPMTVIIFENRGTVDKYVGDMIMAFWGAPLSDEHHARNGVRAALQMLAKVDELKPEFEAAGFPEVNIGIGLNTGEMNVGNMGSEIRAAYTVLGDAVNLGSRLEGLTKFYGVKCIVGEQTREGLDEFLFRQLDRVRVKGKHEPVLIYEPVCRSGDATPAQVDEVARHDQAVAAYLECRWDEAGRLFHALAAEHPDTRIYQIYLERMAGLDPAQLPADWDGVFEHKTK